MTSKGSLPTPNLSWSYAKKYFLKTTVSLVFTITQLTYFLKGNKAKKKCKITIVPGKSLSLKNTLPLKSMTRWVELIGKGC